MLASVQMLGEQICGVVRWLELEGQQRIGREYPQERMHPMIEPLSTDIRTPMPRSTLQCSGLFHRQNTGVASRCAVMKILPVADDIILGYQSERSSASRATSNAAPIREAALCAPPNAAVRPALDKRVS